ncbi:MAG: hypothetical protein HC913_03700 [Microscillaceae bacterium]|nr:hypothetical protein [Microscillaceae bacterium]
MENSGTKEFNFFEYHTQISRENILLSYKGPLTDILLAEFSRDIRKKLQAEDSKTGKKVFAIFMELAQNVLFYSKEENHFGSNRDKVGTLVIIQNEPYYQLITGNLVFKKDIPFLQEKCEVINSLDRDALREYKRQLRNAPKGEEESRGAGIGLVQAALTSDNPLGYQIQELSGNFAFFVVTVTVEK